MSAASDFEYVARIAKLDALDSLADRIDVEMHKPGVEPKVYIGVNVVLHLIIDEIRAIKAEVTK